MQKEVGLRRADIRHDNSLHSLAARGDLRGLSQYMFTEKINDRDWDDTTALNWAVMANHPLAAALLVGGGADPCAASAAGNTPLHSAASKDDSSFVALLASLGANLDAQNSEGMTPLHLAADGGYVKTTGLLLELGANPSIKNSQGLTPEQLARGKDSHVVAARLRAAPPPNRSR